MKNVVIKWVGGKPMASLQIVVQTKMLKRLELIGMHLQKSLMKKLGKPVTKGKRTRFRSTSRGAAGSSYTFASNRSKAGEYPRADSTNLMTGVFYDVIKNPVSPSVRVGHQAKYGVILEEKLNRKLLRANLYEEMAFIQRVARVGG